MSGDLTALCAHEIAGRVNAWSLGARNVTAAHIARIEERNPALNAIVGFDAQAVLAETQAVD